jgi:hypothetical protein
MVFEVPHRNPDDVLKNTLKYTYYDYSETYQCEKSCAPKAFIDFLNSYASYETIVSYLQGLDIQNMPDYKQYNLEYMSVAYGRFDILQYLTIDCGLGLRSAVRNPSAYRGYGHCFCW